MGGCWGVPPFLGRGTASSAFNPLTTSPYVALRGDNVVGSPITTWTDRTGNARSATGASGAQPGVGTGINGQATVTFNGSKYLTESWSLGTGAQSIYVCYKTNPVPASSTFYTLGAWTGSGSSTLLYITNYAGYTTVSLLCGWTSGTTAVGFNYTTDTNPHSLLVVYNGSGSATPANYTMFLDGVSKTVVASSAFGSSSAALAALGSDNSASATDGFVGEIAELIVWPAAISSTVQGQMVGTGSYSLGRYGV